ncbi:hypothetical protein ABID56_002339 [Alkalibacillus flavidus]|uniref:Ig-like domain (Group 3) n=1 Tax=Alkalibacillus flavidus TaxID=546021 RepID=A0ABV2KX97_9BACI
MNNKTKIASIAALSATATAFVASPVAANAELEGIYDIENGTFMSLEAFQELSPNEKVEHLLDENNHMVSGDSVYKMTDIITKSEEDLLNSAETVEDFETENEVSLSEIKDSSDVTDELTVESVSAINATKVEVTFANGTTETITLDSALEDGATTVSFEYNGQTFTDVALDEAFVAPTEASVDSVTATVNDDQTVTVSGDVSLADKVEVTIDGTTTEATLTDGSYTFTSSALSDGLYTVTVTAYDADGKVDTASESVSVVEQTGETGIAGYVVGSDLNGTPVEGLELNISGTTVTTDADGYFEASTSTGSKRVELSYDGYVDNENYTSGDSRISVKDGKLTGMVLDLSQDMTKIQPEVTASTNTEIKIPLNDNEGNPLTTSDVTISMQKWDTQEEMWITVASDISSAVGSAGVATIDENTGTPAIGDLTIGEQYRFTVTGASYSNAVTRELTISEENLDAGEGDLYTLDNVVMENAESVEAMTLSGQIFNNAIEDNDQAATANAVEIVDGSGTNFDIDMGAVNGAMGNVTIEFNASSGASEGAVMSGDTITVTLDSDTANHSASELETLLQGVTGTPSTFDATAISVTDAGASTQANTIVAANTLNSVTVSNGSGTTRNLSENDIDLELVKSNDSSVEALTDFSANADGTFTFSAHNLVSGTYYLKVKDDTSLDFAQKVIPVEITEGQDKDIKVVLDTDLGDINSLSGDVLSSVDGQTLKTGSNDTYTVELKQHGVTLLTKKNQDSPDGDSEGFAADELSFGYNFANIADGDYQAVVSGDYNVTKTENINVTEDVAEDLEITQAGIVKIDDIRTSSEYSENAVTVLLTDENGNPILGDSADFTGLADNSGDDAVLPEFKAVPQGAKKVKVLSKDHFVGYLDTDASSSVDEIPNFDFSDNASGYDITLSADPEITLTPNDKLDFSSFVKMNGLPVDSADVEFGSTSTTTAANGGFSVTDKTPGSYEVVITDSDGATNGLFATTTLTVDLVNQDVTRPSIDVEEVDPSSLEFTSNVELASITAVNEHGYAYTGTVLQNNTDALLEELPAGDYTITATPATGTKYAPYTFTKTISEGSDVVVDNTFEQSYAATVSFTKLDGGATTNEARVVIYDSEGNEVSYGKSSGNSYKFDVSEGLTAGDYTAKVFVSQDAGGTDAGKDEAAVGSKDFTITDQSVTVNINLEQY